MQFKKKILVILLILLASTLAYTLGKIDFFSFFDSNHTLNIIMLLSAITAIYLISFTIFLLDFSDRNYLIRLYLIISIFFGVILYSISKNLASTAVATIFFFGLIDYIYARSLSRSKMFIKFQPSDIFQPVVKTSFLWLVVLFATISYLQATSLAKNNILIDKVVTIIVSQISPIFSKQLSSQISEQFSQVPEDVKNNVDKEMIIRMALKQSIEAMSEAQVKNWIGLKPADIPIERAAIGKDGSVDLRPVFDAMTPSISSHIAKKFNHLLTFAPLIIAVIILIILQSLLWPFHILAGIITPALFFILSSTGFIKRATEYVEVERMVL